MLVRVVRSRLFGAVVAAFAAVGMTVAAAPAQAASSTSSASSVGSVAGANDFSCRPSQAHPFPVVLVHGTFANASSFGALSPQLANAGYCVFALNYGCQALGPVVCATGPIEESAQQLSAFIDQVRAATGASKVDIVGHSQGGMMPRYYMRFLAGASRVHRLVGLAPSNHGTTLNGLQNLVSALSGVLNCDACQQQLAGSAFLARLNAGADTLPGVLYTVIESRFDEVVTPFTSAFLTGPAVTNILLQNSCPLDLTGHLGILVDPNAIGWVQNALDSRVPAPGCTPFLLSL
ncbi:MAG TPA: alpha/beta fold hydrolase [Candidatus Dormibacteraeota bacterium]